MFMYGWDCCSHNPKPVIRKVFVRYVERRLWLLVMVYCDTGVKGSLGNDTWSTSVHIRPSDSKEGGPWTVVKT